MNFLQNDEKTGALMAHITWDSDRHYLESTTQFTVTRHTVTSQTIQPKLT